MNELPEEPSGDDVGDQPRERWRQYDDTLDDAADGGDAAGAVPDEVKRWLGEQRFLHGLLRALHTADAAARESRITSLLERIDGERRMARRSWRHWAMVSAAALLMAVVGLWFVLPASLPTAEAAMSRAVAELARDVDRRFHLELRATDGKLRLHHEFALVTRPGNRFRIDGKFAFGTIQFGELRIGCDGTEMWVLPANGMFRRAAPIAQRERLMKGFGDKLDLGYLDVHDLVEKLPRDFELRVVGRETGDDGRAVLRIEAERRAGAPVAGGGVLQSAWLLCDEPTGMVTRLEVQVERGKGIVHQVSLRYLGEESPGLVDYQRPW